MNDDQGKVRVQDYESRFKGILEEFLANLSEKAAAGSDGEELAARCRRLLDEYAVVITKRFEGSMVSVEEALRLSPADLAQLIPALRARIQSAQQRLLLEDANAWDDLAMTKQLFARVLEMAESYGDKTPDDVLWPVLDKNPEVVPSEENALDAALRAMLRAPFEGARALSEAMRHFGASFMSQVIDGPPADIHHKPRGDFDSSLKHIMRRFGIIYVQALRIDDDVELAEQGVPIGHE